MDVPVDDILITDREGFRNWLESNPDAGVCYLRISVREGDPGVAYLDAVEEALCFGWIDSTMKKVDSVGRVQRFTPRRKGGRWTELNKARCERLERLGLMTERGRMALSFAPEFSVDEDIMAAISADRETHENFLSFPELYRKVRIDNIQSFRDRPEIFRKRLEKFLDNTRRGVMYGRWNDDGRLP